ncbi:hypothetical protein HD554DRAFT_2172345 [Boletus coccyginus]|nr:hypothetical protein HD554DRAFT_2172345 [Boletus coccyginus]
MSPFPGPSLGLLAQSMATLPSFNSTLGALFIGFSVSTVIRHVPHPGIQLLSSISFGQGWVQSDRRTAIFFFRLLETAHQAFIGHSVYYYSITNFMNILALLGKPLWSLVFQLLVGAVVGTVVKLYVYLVPIFILDIYPRSSGSLFTLRVWRFSYGNVWLTAFLMLLDFGQLGLAIVFTVQRYQVSRIFWYNIRAEYAYPPPSYALPALPDLDNLRVLGIVALAIGVLTDIGIATALCYYLQSMRLYYTQSAIIRSLTLYAVNTGILTSAMSFTTLIIFNYMPDNFIFVGCYFVLSKLYAISFVATLNTRQIVRGRGTDGEPKKSPVFQIVTDQRSRSPNIPLQTPAAERDAVDMESRGQENVVPAPSTAYQP